MHFKLNLLYRSYKFIDCAETVTTVIVSNVVIKYCNSVFASVFRQLITSGVKSKFDECVNIMYGRIVIQTYPKYSNAR